jgi:hypothetical protein
MFSARLPTASWMRSLHLGQFSRIAFEPGHGEPLAPDAELELVQACQRREAH